jgi:hypothetical protein
MPCVLARERRNHYFQFRSAITTRSRSASSGVTHRSNTVPHAHATVSPALADLCKGVAGRAEFRTEHSWACGPGHAFSTIGGP